MEVELVPTPADHVAANVYLWETLPAARRKRLLLRWGIAAVFVAGGTVWGVLSGWMAPFVLVVLGLAWPLYWPWAMRRYFGRMVRRLAARDPSLLGAQRIKIAGEGLEVETGGETTVQPWEEIRGVATSASHIFILSRAMSFLVVPRAAFPSVEKARAFIDEISRRAAQGGMGPL
jgi:hypothetical protein